VTEGRLITKAEAIGRLGRYCVPDRLVGEIARRRAGETVPLPWPYRLRRAWFVWELMLRGIASVAGDR
jgi:hypothetical protein